jgi:hypothetical protein
MIVHNPLGIERIARSKVGIHYFKAYIPNPHDIITCESVTRGGEAHTLFLSFITWPTSKHKIPFQAKERNGYTWKYTPNVIYKQTLKELHYE